jgi:hypothetical protein
MNSYVREEIQKDNSILAAKASKENKTGMAVALIADLAKQRRLKQSQSNQG